MKYQLILPPRWVGRLVNHEPDLRQPLGIPTAAPGRSGAGPRNRSPIAAALRQDVVHATCYVVAPVRDSPCNAYPVSTEGPQRQVNVRLPEADYEILRTLAWLDKTTEAEIVRSILLDYIERRRHSESVQAAFRVQAHHQAEKVGKVSDLPSVRRRRSPKSRSSGDK